jgi:hypothetical protein
VRRQHPAVPVAFRRQRQVRDADQAGVVQHQSRLEILRPAYGAVAIVEHECPPFSAVN